MSSGALEKEYTALFSAKNKLYDEYSKARRLTAKLKPAKHFLNRGGGHVEQPAKSTGCFGEY